MLGFINPDKFPEITEELSASIFSFDENIKQANVKQK
jgi:hypothetical protein